MGITQRRLSRKLLLLLLTPTVVCIILYGFFTASWRRAELLAEADRELMDELTALRATLPEIATRVDPMALKKVTEAITQRQRVHGIVVYDRTCKVIARSADLVADSDYIDAIACPNGRPAAWHGVATWPHTEPMLVRAEPIDNPLIGGVAVTYHLKQVEAIIQHGTNQLMLAGLVLVVMIGTLVLFAARPLSRSLAGLVYAAEEVRLGNLSAQVEPPALDFLQLSRVVESFNLMVGALAVARDDLARVAEERSAFEQRIRHSEALSIVGQVAASMAHDIGSPLTTILGWAQLAADDQQLPEASRASARLVATQCERITRILAQFLAMSRPPRQERGRVDIGEALAEVAAFLALECKRRDISMEIERRGDDAVIIANRDQLLQMVINLAMNAMDAQKNGGRIILAIHSLGSEVEVAVRDAGPGVPAEIRDRIFEPFFSTRADRGGHGLGLATVARIAGDLGGQVRIEDAPEGGAGFIIRLPRDSNALF